LTEAIPLCLLR